MATQDLNTTQEWKNAVTELSLTDGQKYILQTTGGHDVLRLLSDSAPDDSVKPFRMCALEVWPFTASTTTPLWLKALKIDTIVSIEEAP